MVTMLPESGAVFFPSSIVVDVFEFAEKTATRIMQLKATATRTIQFRDDEGEVGVVDEGFIFFVCFRYFCLHMTFSLKKKVNP